MSLFLIFLHSLFWALRKMREYSIKESGCGSFCLNQMYLRSFLFPPHILKHTHRIKIERDNFSNPNIKKYSLNRSNIHLYFNNEMVSLNIKQNQIKSNQTAKFQFLLTPV